MAKIIMQVTGRDGQIDLMNDRVVIHRKGIFNMFKYGINAKKEIPIAAISNINFRDAHVLKFGEIAFDYAGRSHVDEKENAVTFNKKDQHAFFSFKEKVFELMAQLSRAK